jgi:hypothetical protein
MHKRLSRIFAVLSLLSVLPAVSHASSARVNAMNVPGDYIKDYTGIYTYLSGVGGVGNLVYAEPSGTGNQAMGAVLGNLFEGRLGTWGVNLRRFAPTLGQPLAGDPLTTSNLFGDPNANGEAFDILWGKKMGNGNLGLRLNRSFISNENTAPAGTTEGNGNNGRNIWGLGAGFGFAMNANSDVELSGLFQNRSFKGTNAATASTAADDGGSTYQIAGRSFMKAGGNLVVVPVVKFYSFDESSVDASAVPIKTDQKLSGWQFGLSGDWSIGSDDLFILGANFVGNHFEQTIGAGAKTDVHETFYPNVFMGLETHVNSWLTLRFGGQNAMLYSQKAEAGNPTQTQTLKLHSFTFNMGAGVKLGSLAFDATLNPNFWNNPFSGTINNNNTIAANPFPQVSATYSF